MSQVETSPDETATRPEPSRIAAAFARCRAEGRAALIPYVTAGYPNLAMTEALVMAQVAGGADLIEIGVPFSDPLADGATVQRTSQIALANGTSLTDCLDVVRRLRREHNVRVPIVLMGYFNPFLQFGLDLLAAESAATGVDGLIIPDLPIEESDEVIAALRAHERDLILMLAPTSTERRIRDVASRASGFIYCVSLTGVTGARDHLAGGLADYIGRIREATDVPLAVGFGISRPEHVRAVSAIADGVVVASALLNHLDRFPEAEQPAAATAFVQELRAATPRAASRAGEQNA